MAETLASAAKAARAAKARGLGEGGKPSAARGSLTRGKAVRAQGPTRTERRKAETRRRLLGATRRLFVERGYDATRPQDIARMADVGAGTFYLHFPDKPAAFLAFTDQAASELLEQVHLRLAGKAEFRTQFAAALEAVLDYRDRHPGVLRAAFADEAVISTHLPGRAGLRQRLAAQLAEMLRRAMARNEIYADYDPLVIAWGIVGMVQQSCGVGRPDDRAQLLDNLIRFCERALGPEPAASTREVRQ